MRKHPQALTPANAEFTPVAKANTSLQLNAAIVTLARMRAVKAVKRQYQARGLKVHHFARREIVIAANEYLREHHELITEAAVVVEQWRKEGFFGKRAMRCAPLNTNAQTTKA